MATNRLEISECRLRLAHSIKEHESPPLRELFGDKFNEGVTLHNHDPDGKPIYEYPRVQLKILDSAAVLVGINEGSELLQRLWVDIDETELGSEQFPVTESRLETRRELFDATDEPIEYRFHTPWLALNQKNFHEYTRSRNQKFRRDELSRILVGNCLGMSKSLGIHFSNRISADCRKLTSIKTSLRGKGMIGFFGKFSVNLAIPEYLGLGKSVSRGFGTVASP